ncbi:MAG: hypothetical protein Q8N91_07360 [Candidatus Omnitrophota bacterium]|nr:hypothetical protein [Candidatus Omnitrophota bacterium]
MRRVRAIEIFVANSALLFLIVGSVLMLSPALFRKVSDFFNRTIVSIDETMLRRPVGILFLGVSIFLWYVALYKL